MVVFLVSFCKEFTVTAENQLFEAWKINIVRIIRESMRSFGPSWNLRRRTLIGTMHNARKRVVCCLFFFRSATLFLYICDLNQLAYFVYCHWRMCETRTENIRSSLCTSFEVPCRRTGTIRVCQSAKAKRGVINVHQLAWVITFLFLRWNIVFAKGFLTEPYDSAHLKLMLKDVISSSSLWQYERLDAEQPLKVFYKFKIWSERNTICTARHRNFLFSRFVGNIGSFWILIRRSVC